MYLDWCPHTLYGRWATERVVGTASGRGLELSARPVFTPKMALSLELKNDVSISVAFMQICYFNEKVRVGGEDFLQVHVTTHDSSFPVVPVRLLLGCAPPRPNPNPS